MNQQTLRALAEAGAIKRVRIVGRGACFHVEGDTPKGSFVACTMDGKTKTWSTLDTAAKWVRGLGLGRAQLHIGEWQPDQRALRL